MVAPVRTRYELLAMANPAAPPSTEQRARAAASGGDKRRYVKAMFSDIAPRYDLLNHLLSFNTDRRWRRQAIRALEYERDADGLFLDLCAGTLDMAVELATQEGFHGSVIGADFAEPMLRAGQAKIDGRPIYAVSADALTLPIASDSCAGAVVAFGIRNLADLDAGLSEVLRVLKPGSRFVILEFTTPRLPLVRSGYRFYFHQVLPFLGGIISGNPGAYRYLPESVAHFPEATQLAERMRSAGFDGVKWTSLTFGVAAIHTGVKP
jgi:demethylmenaquinone methyltransferase/2-methoxy-6-polyprenyl-1,4-benzoquinol methylase